MSTNTIHTIHTIHFPPSSFLPPSSSFLVPPRSSSGFLPRFRRFHHHTRLGIQDVRRRYFQLQIYWYIIRALLVDYTATRPLIGWLFLHKHDLKGVVYSVLVL